MSRTREDLIRLCELNSAIAGNVNDEDSIRFHKEHGVCWALLKANCVYCVKEEERFLTVFVTYPSFALAGKPVPSINVEPLSFVLATTFRNNLDRNF